MLEQSRLRGEGLTAERRLGPTSRDTLEQKGGLAATADVARVVKGKSVYADRAREPERTATTHNQVVCFARLRFVRPAFADVKPKASCSSAALAVKLPSSPP